MAERRRSQRQKSFLRGCIYFNNRRSALDCLIRDISDEGARVIFSGTVNVPDIVDLYIPQKRQTVPAHVQWHHGDEIGLAFSAGAKPTGAAPEIGNLPQRVAALESEVAALRRLLKQLKNELPGTSDMDAA